MKARLEQARIFNAASLFNYSEKQIYYQNESKFKGVYSRNNLLKIKDGAYIINLAEFNPIQDSGQPKRPCLTVFPLKLLQT